MSVDNLIINNCDLREWQSHGLLQGFTLQDAFFHWEQQGDEDMHIFLCNTHTHKSPRCRGSVL